MAATGNNLVEIAPKRRGFGRNALVRVVALELKVLQVATVLHTKRSMTLCGWEGQNY